jgi:tetratricopeptide (TPR) repeat protein
MSCSANTKLFLIFTLFWVSTVNCFSQTCNDLRKKVDELQKLGKIKDAIKIAESGIEICKKEIGEDNPTYASFLNKLGLLYKEVGNYSQAEHIFIKALEIRNNLLGEEHPDYANSLHNLASLYKKMGEYTKAEPLLVKAIAVKRKIYGDDNMSYLSSITNLASIYKGMGNFVKAEHFYIQIISIIKKVYGEENSDYATSLNNLALLYELQAKYEQAEPLFIKAINIQKKAQGEENLNYARFIENLALHFNELAKYKQAEALFIQAINIEKKLLGEEHPDFAISLNNLASLYNKIGQYDKGETLLLQALQIKKNKLSEENQSYIKSIIHLATLYSENGVYSKAESLYVNTLNIQKKILKTEHPDYAISLNGLALVYEDQGKLTQAEALFIQALTIQKKVLGNYHPDYANSLIGLGLLYQKQAKYVDAEALFIQVLEIRKKILGVEHPHYASVLGNLAILYTDLGNYSKAEPLYQEALAIHKNTLGENSRKYAASLNMLALFYQKLKLNNKAELLFIQALTIEKNLYGEEHRNYSEILNNLALSYYETGAFAKAEPLFIQSLAITKKNLGEEHPNYAFLLSNLGLVYLDQGKYSEAEPLFKTALEIRLKIFGEEHPDYITSLHNIASLYREMGYNSKSEFLHLKTLDATKKVQGEECLDYSNTLHSIASLYEKMGNYTRADEMYSQSLSITYKNWKSNFSFLSTPETTSFLDGNLFSIELPISFLSRKTTGLITSDLFNFSLLIKNVLLSNNHFLEEAASKIQDTEVSTNWKQYKTLRLQISKKLQKSTSDQVDLNLLKDEVEVLEKKLMQKLPEFRNSIINNKLTWRDIKSKLKPDELAVDFVSFRYYDKHWTDSTLYAAFLIRSEWTEPKFVNLFREEDLSVLFENANNSIGINELYSSNNSLYNLIWYPMDSLLTGVKKVYVSPSGLINRVSLSAIPVPEGGHLNDRYDIQVMGNLRVLAEKKSITSTPSTSILFGGIDYNDEPIVTTTTTGNNFEVMDSTLRSLRGGKWTNLVGTAEEISHIQKIHSTNGITNRVYSKNNASEEIFKSIGNGKNPTPSILHIATHGFAFSTPENRPKNSDKLMQLSTGLDKSNVFKLTTDPLTRAGLVLAGGNKVWSTGDTYPNKEDGILTAREISNMNLRGCTLATLSACETGLGEIKGSEGVFGLQRAFKMAGVQHLIVSLWKVPDRETSEFMETFNNNWLTNKLPLREAFRKTQQLMSKKYKPYQWAAFVLME